MKKVMLFVVISLFVFTAFCMSASENPIFSVIIFRHGDRTPLEPLAANAYNWGEDYGALTPLGMQEEFKLGELLRKKYIEEYKLLPEAYDSNALYVRSVPMDRTLMSAECVLYGLYPSGTGPELNGKPALPYKFQPIPVYTVEKERDTLLSGQSVYKAKIKKLQDKYVYNSKEWLAKENELKQYFKLWSSASGEKITSLKKAKSFASNIFIRSLHNVPIPKDVDTKEQKEILIPLASWMHAQEFKPQRVGVITSSDYLENFITVFDNFKNKKSTIKCYLYSAHDTNILAIMSALGVPLDENPHYSSYLAFNVYEIEGDYYLKVVYNDKTVKLSIDVENDLCKMSEFKKYIDAIQKND